MEICHVTPFFFPHIGGEEKCVYEIVKGEKKQGHNVSVITSNIPKRILSQYPFQVIESNSFLLANMPVSISAIPKIMKEISNKDVIHIHFPPPWSFTLTRV